MSSVRFHSKNQNFINFRRDQAEYLYNLAAGKDYTKHKIH